jgi:signal transduction histidine kinase
VADRKLSFGQTAHDLQASPEAMLRRQVLDRMAYALACLLIGATLARHLSVPIKPLQLTAIAGLAALLLVTPVLTRRVRRAEIAALPLCTVMLLLVMGAGWKHGGLRAPVSALLPIMPILGHFLGGKRLGAALLVASVLVTVGLLLAGSYGLVEPVVGDLDRDRSKAIVYCFLAATSYVIGAVFERSRRLAEQQLVEVSRLASLGIMAGGIAHEINNPLAIVAGFSDKLAVLARRRELDPAEVERLAERLISTTKRMAAIVTGLRTYSRDDAQEPLQAVGIARVVEDSLALCRGRFLGAGIELRVGAIPAESTIMARPVQVTQVLLNLLNNAFDAASDSQERWVALEVDSLAEVHAIRVSDSGPGVPEALRAKIFVPFFTTKPVGKGTGLGLSLCASIMNAHGGDVILASPTKHTTFVLRFPAAAATAQASAA